MTSIAFERVTKRYGNTVAVDRFDARAEVGRVTAFLGPNGSGKTTCMRMLVGLAEPTEGRASIGGRRYVDLPHPARVVGAVLEPGFHPRRSARNHLRIAAMQADVPSARVDEVLEVVALDQAARRNVGTFSLGMRQRLALASALIGRPRVLVLDEPFNGLDPDGVRTTRDLLRRFADDGGTVLLSTHQLSEIEGITDDTIVIGPAASSTRPTDHLAEECSS